MDQCRENIFLVTSSKYDNKIENTVKLVLVFFAPDLKGRAKRGYQRGAGCIISIKVAFLLRRPPSSTLLVIFSRILQLTDELDLLHSQAHYAEL